MASYGRDVSQSEINAAQFQNYLRAPQALQQAMRAVPHNSDAYYNLQNAVRSAEQDLAMAPGVVQVGTDGQRHQWAPPAASPDRITAGALSYLPPSTMRSNAMARLVQPPGSSEALAAGLPSRQRTGPGAAFERGMQDPANARGIPGATFGEVNGVSMLVPEAGQYGKFRSSVSELGLDGTMGVDRGEFEQRRFDFVQGQERARRGERFEQRKAAQQQFEQQRELAGLKNPVNQPKTGLELRRDLTKEFIDQRNNWVKDQQLAQNLEAAINASLRANNRQEGADPMGFKVQVGYQGGKPEVITVGEARARLSALRRPEPTREEFAATLGVDPSWLDLNQLDAPAQASSGRSSGQSGASRQSAAAELDNIPVGNLDRAIAIARQKNPADVPYLEQRKRQAAAMAKASAAPRS